MSQTDIIYDDRTYENPALYDGVRSKRVFAFIIDYALVLLLCIPVSIVIFFVGLLTLGLGFFLYGILFLLVAIPYIGFTLGSESQATPGMRAMGIRLERLDGRRIDFVFAVVHSVLFWAANAILTPLILLAALVLDRKQTLHDRLLGTVVVRTDTL
ncbi:putative RDD family membrane protein YckC [Hoeflea marina]|uniref:Putative RDD family membrane protein YckC n=1 Tax=Hoeflea marina TaxID=274592 RepID=A0A317PPI4_9HYPH|nr:RDD family protein [Hoeflea marina]PWW03408.1 putative RDD family membrane protein YckC [Hoeflea marina]